MIKGADKGREAPTVQGLNGADLARLESVEMTLRREWNGLAFHKWQVLRAKIERLGYRGPGADGWMPIATAPADGFMTGPTKHLLAALVLRLNELWNERASEGRIADQLGFCRVIAEHIVRSPEVAPDATDAEHAAWLADKIVALGDYAKEAAGMLRCWPDGAAHWMPPPAPPAESGERCRKCDGAMKPSKAMGQTFDTSDEGTCSPSGPGALIDCMKCSVCGWSVSAPPTGAAEGAKEGEHG